MKTSWSLEFFPPRNNESVDALVATIRALCLKINPSFCTVTWKAGATSRYSTPRLAEMLQNNCGITTMIHIAGIDMKKDQMLEFLTDAQSKGLRNIIVLRGDKSIDNVLDLDFPTALDLLKFIRHEFGSYFHIGVAAYPECHPEFPHDTTGNMQYLKAKVTAGADFVITQAVFYPNVFTQFVKCCREEWGITCPIIPGVLNIKSHAGLLKFTDLCKVSVRESDIDALKQNASHGIDMTSVLCTTLIHNGNDHIHVYTMNDAENTVKLYEKVIRNIQQHEHEENGDSICT